VPLAEIIAEVKGVKSTQSKKVVEEYTRLTDQLADEFTLLLDVSYEEIKRVAYDEYLAEAIRRMRVGELKIKPGYDGVYGEVRIFEKDDLCIPIQSSIL
jgi:PHP family Zn ribbon phosphoesterase